jgi:hypothetical protein
LEVDSVQEVLAVDLEGVVDSAQEVRVEGLEELGLAEVLGERAGDQVAEASVVFLEGVVLREAGGLEPLLRDLVVPSLRPLPQGPGRGDRYSREEVALREEVDLGQE